MAIFERLGDGASIYNPLDPELEKFYGSMPIRMVGWAWRQSPLMRILSILPHFRPVDCSPRLDQRPWTLLLISCLFGGLQSFAAYAETSAPGEVLVRWKDIAAKPTSSRDPIALNYGLVSREEIFPLYGQGAAAKRASLQQLSAWQRLVFPPGTNVAALVAAYAGLEAVEAVQPNYLRRFAASPNDSLYSRQANLTQLGWAFGQVPNAASVLVAVVDSGVDYTHPDISNNIWRNKAEVEGLAGVDDDGNGYIDDRFGWDFTHAPSVPGRGDYLERDGDPFDESGHGTHVAGIIAATTNNGSGIAGVAPGVGLMVLRAGFNSDLGGQLEDDDIAAAIVYAADNGADIINMSFGDLSFSPLVRDAVRYAYAAGCVMVAAVGNDGVDQIFYPARFDETIAVAALGTASQVLSFSNRGYSLDLAAPGQSILSLGLGGIYVEQSGTSMAAAHVSGLAALVLARQPHWSPEQVRGALTLSARGSGPGGWNWTIGAGIAQASAAYINGWVTARLLEPSSESALSAGVPIRAQIQGSDLQGYNLSWGSGADPKVWQSLAEGPVGDSVLETLWPTADLEPGPYVLRLQVINQQSLLEDRVLVYLTPDPVELVELSVERVMDGPRWSYLVEWTTQQPANALLRVVPQGRDEPLFEIAVPGVRLRQSLPLPAQLGPGAYRVEITSADGGAVLAEADVEVGKNLINDWDIRSIARFPSGYMLPWLSDFDRDTRLELVQMDLGGSRYNTATFFEYSSDEPQLVHTTSQLFIPWNIHDLDGDGLEELMAVDGARVRLLEPISNGAFPTRVIWQQDETWGGEAADLDGDGATEIYLRSSTANHFRIFESPGDNRLEEVNLLVNSTDGTNQLGERQVVADLDGDGWGELVASDDDGDLFIYEGAADNVWRPTWTEPAPFSGDGRTLGGGADLDGDGRMEFVLGRLSVDLLALGRSHWVLQVYQSTGDNSFALEWQMRILGGQSSGNGISMADLNQDGVPEIVFGAVPNLYVLTSVAPNAYQPVWHGAAGITYRPASGDLDGDGRVELSYNGPDQAQVLSLVDGPVTFLPPEGLEVVAADGTQIVLAWLAVEGAVAYRVFRGGEVLAPYIDRVMSTSFTDTEVELGETYHYGVAALSASGEVGRLAQSATVVVGPPPRVVAVSRVGPQQLAVDFTAPLKLAVDSAHLFAIEGLGPALSALADQGGQRVLLGFAQLPEPGSLTLSLGSLSGRSGVPLAEESRRFAFVLEGYNALVQALEIRVLSPRLLQVSFSAPVLWGAASQVRFETGDIEVARADLAAADLLEIELAENTPLQALGRRFPFEIVGLRDQQGRPLQLRLFAELDAQRLEDVLVFPNPYRPAAGPLAFGGLPIKTQVHIYTGNGQVVRKLVVERGGGVLWDGRNDKGRRVGAGIYYFRASWEGVVRQGKFALVRP